MTGETTHRFLAHDRDGIYSPAVDGALHSLGLQVLKTPGGLHHEYGLKTVAA